MPTHSTRCAGGPRDERRSPNAGRPVTGKPPTGGGEQPDFSADSTHRPNGGDERKRPQRAGRDAMFRKLVEDIELWHGNDGRGYATIEINDHREHWPVLGGAFAKWLRLRAQLNGEPMLGAMEIGKLTENLEARCLLLGQLHNICHRVGWHDGKIYVDLADDQWRAVEIVPAKPDTTQRWRIVDRPPVRLLRTSGMRSMPAPAPGGTIDDLRQWMNVKSEADLRLTIAWVLNCYRDRGPFPVLGIQGGQGSGKSTLARLLMRFTDPQEADLRSPPKEERDLWVATQHARVLAYDNLSSISAGLADAFCRISTGGAQAERTLHSNTDETILRACRPLMLNAIVDIVRRPDLADRAIQVEAKRLTGRWRTEEEFWAEFEQEEPLLLGAIFDALSFALGNYKQTTVPANLRMADCARWAEAPAPSLNWRPGELSVWWQQNRASGDLTIIEGDIVAAPLVAFLDGQGDRWEGATGELLTRLEETVNDKVRRSKYWPVNVHGLRSTLDRLQTSLGTVGWTFEREKGTRGARKLIFTRIESESENPA